MKREAGSSMELQPKARTITIAEFYNSILSHFQHNYHLTGLPLLSQYISSFLPTSTFF